jgi:hypothetical protein
MIGEGNGKRSTDVLPYDVSGERDEARGLLAYAARQVPGVTAWKLKLQNPESLLHSQILYLTSQEDHGFQYICTVFGVWKECILDLRRSFGSGATELTARQSVYMNNCTAKQRYLISRMESQLQEKVQI